MNKFEKLEKQNLRHVSIGTGVYLKNTEGELCEFCLEYFVHKDISDKEMNEYHKNYLKVIEKVTEDFIMNFDDGSTGVSTATNECATCEELGQITCWDGSCADSEADCPEEGV